MKDCLYVPQTRRNLISISKLVEQGHTFLFGQNKVSIKFNNRFVTCGLKENGLYLLTLPPNVLACENGSIICITNTNKRKRDEIVPTYLWHFRLGHINVDKINRLVKDDPLDFLKVELYPICESCLQGKMTKLPFTGKGERAMGVLDLIHNRYVVH